MVRRRSHEVAKIVLVSAMEEARRRGDRRIGTDHLLLGLLHDPSSNAGEILGIDLESARAAAAELDMDALRQIGLDPAGWPEWEPMRSKGRMALTSGARHILSIAWLDARRRKSREIDTKGFLRAILTEARPDPAAELLAALNVDIEAARAQLN
jgi:ATP-dependent Clp protease ATP-binding subunit ClpA